MRPRVGYAREITRGSSKTLKVHFVLKWTSFKLNSIVLFYCVYLYNPIAYMSFISFIYYCRTLFSRLIINKLSSTQTGILEKRTEFRATSGTVSYICLILCGTKVSSNIRFGKFIYHCCKIVAYSCTDAIESHWQTTDYTLVCSICRSIFYKSSI